MPRHDPSTSHRRTRRRPPPSGRQLVEKLPELAKLKEMGTLTDAEFTAAKAALLS